MFVTMACGTYPISMRNGRRRHSNTVKVEPYYPARLSMRNGRRRHSNTVKVEPYYLTRLAITCNHYSTLFLSAVAPCSTVFFLSRCMDRSWLNFGTLLACPPFPKSSGGTHNLQNFSETGIDALINYSSSAMHSVCSSLGDHTTKSQNIPFVTKICSWHW